MYRQIDEDAACYTTSQFVSKFEKAWSIHTLSSQISFAFTYGRVCAPVYACLRPHQKIGYILAETSLHSIAVSSQMFLSCSALGLKVNKGKLAKDVIKVTYKNALTNKRTEFPK